MSWKKFNIILLAVLVVAECFLMPVRAAEDNSVFLSDIASEAVDTAKVVFLENDLIPLTTGSVNCSVEAHTLATASEKFYLEAGEIVTINCSYTPSFASVDFGLISSSGVFSLLNVTGGSINTGIRVNQYDSYTFAIRNNSANTIRVTGYITY